MFSFVSFPRLNLGHHFLQPWCRKGARSIPIGHNVVASNLLQWPASAQRHCHFKFIAKHLQYFSHSGFSISRQRENHRSTDLNFNNSRSIMLSFLNLQLNNVSKKMFYGYLQKYQKLQVPMLWKRQCLVEHLRLRIQVRDLVQLSQPEVMVKD